jgi:hypothetical protein
MNLSPSTIQLLRDLKFRDEEIARVANDNTCYDEYQVQIHESNIHVIEPRGEYDTTWAQLEA